MVLWLWGWRTWLCKRASPFKPRTPEKYMEPIENGRLPILEEHKVPLEEQMEEEMFLGLRKTEGVSISRFKEKFGKDPLELFKVQIKQHAEKELIIAEEEHIKLTRRGRFLGNEVFQSFIG